MKSPHRERRVIVLAGPTASGKSFVAVHLAQKLQTEIISADSRMIYRGMDIGTAKPERLERADINHHLIDKVDPDQPFSAGQFKALASKIIEQLHEKGKIPIIVGGTGLYLKLLIRGLWEGPEADWALRGKLYEMESREGAGVLHRRLMEFDPESASNIQSQDLSKLVRAIEVYEKTGRPLSAFHREHRFSEEPYEAHWFGLRWSRGDLYRRIESRVDHMMDRGLVDEVRGLMERGYSTALPSMKGLGYRQIGECLQGQYDMTEALRRIKRDTKRYAKRQMTWFNRDSSIRWVDFSSDMTEGAAAEQIFSLFMSKEIQHA